MFNARTNERPDVRTHARTEIRTAFVDANRDCVFFWGLLLLLSLLLHTGFTRPQREKSDAKMRKIRSTGIRARLGGSTTATDSANGKGFRFPPLLPKILKHSLYTNRPVAVPAEYRPKKHMHKTKKHESSGIKLASTVRATSEQVVQPARQQVGFFASSSSAGGPPWSPFAKNRLASIPRERVRCERRRIE